MTTRTPRFAFLALAVLTLAASLAHSAPAPISPVVTGITLLGSQRISRTVFDYIFEVSIQNPGAAVENVEAALLQSGVGTSIIDGSVAVPSIGAGQLVIANDTIRLRHDRTYAFDPSGLQWTIMAVSGNHAPVANAGSPQSAWLGDSVQLDGADSFDPDGDGLIYSWSIGFAPVGSAATIPAPTSAQPIFTPDLEGSYQLVLVVDDGFLTSPAVSVAVTVRTLNLDPPMVIGIHPGVDAQYVDPYSVISVEFSEEIDPETVYAPVPQIRLFGYDGVVPAQLIVSGSSVVLIPDSPLDLDSTYTVIVTGMRIADLQGQVLEDPLTWDFSTGAAPGPVDSTPPQIDSVTPSPGAKGVIPTRARAISVDFTEPVTPGSVAIGFLVTRSDGSRVNGNVDASAGFRAVFTPYLAPGESFESQTWTVTLTTAVRDFAGNALPASYSWSFETQPSHSAAWLSRPGVGSAGDTDSYYAGLPIRTACRWSFLAGWGCNESGAPRVFTSWLWDLGWSPIGENGAIFYNEGDLGTGRHARCFESGAPVSVPGGPSVDPHDPPGDSPNRYGSARQIACYVMNHGPAHDSADYPDPDRALADAVANQPATSISAIFSKYDSPLDSATIEVEEGRRSVTGTRVFRGDLVTVGPATGSIAPGNLFWATSGPAGVGVGCASNAVDPQPCPIVGGPLYGLLIETPQVRLDNGGAVVSGLRTLGANRLSFKVLAEGYLSFRINDTYPGNGSGQYDVPVVVTRANAVSFMTYVPDGTGAFRLTRSADLDAEGPKQIPQACIACHGGKWDAETQTVTGAALLPFDFARIRLPSSPTWSRANQEEQIRRLNNKVYIAQANRLQPTHPIREWLDGTYSGALGSAGRTANDAFTPPGWSTEPGLYHDVVKPYCQSCHQAMRIDLSFDTSAKFRTFTQTIRTDVCVNRSMPHSGPTFEQFWQSPAPALLSQALFGGAPCP